MQRDDTHSSLWGLNHGSRKKFAFLQMGSFPPVVQDDSWDKLFHSRVRCGCFSVTVQALSGSCISSEKETGFQTEYHIQWKQWWREQGRPCVHKLHLEWEEREFFEGEGAHTMFCSGTTLGQCAVSHSCLTTEYWLACYVGFPSLWRLGERWFGFFHFFFLFIFPEGLAECLPWRLLVNACGLIQRLQAGHK